MRKGQSKLLGPQLVHEPGVWFATHIASYHRSGTCIPPMIQKGLQAHSEEVGQIKTAIGYLFGSLQPNPGSALIPHHHQGAPEQCMQIERWDGLFNSQCKGPQRIWAF